MDSLTEDFQGRPGDLLKERIAEPGFSWDGLFKITSSMTDIFPCETEVVGIPLRI
jgi:hypothetical protein